MLTTSSAEASQIVGCRLEATSLAQLANGSRHGGIGHVKESRSDSFWRERSSTVLFRINELRKAGELLLDRGKIEWARQTVWNDTSKQEIRVGGSQGSVASTEEELVSCSKPQLSRTY